MYRNLQCNIMICKLLVVDPAQQEKGTFQLLEIYKHDSAQQ